MKKTTERKALKLNRETLRGMEGGVDLRLVAGCGITDLCETNIGLTCSDNQSVGC